MTVQHELTNGKDELASDDVSSVPDSEATAVIDDESLDKYRGTELDSATSGQMLETSPSTMGLGMTTAAHAFSAPPPKEKDFEGWPDRPLLQRLRPVDGARSTDDSDISCLRSNTGRPMEVESNLFKGRMLLWTKGLKTTPEGLFDRQRRKSAITLQGRFKQRLEMENVVSGPEFERPYQNLPARWFVEGVLLRIAQKISPRMKFGPMSNPYLQVPVMSLAQRVVVSEPGHEPQLHDRPETGAELYKAVFDDLGGEKSGHFQLSPLKDEKEFDTEHVYTFHIHQHMVDLSTFHLHLLRKFDLVRYLDGQPLQTMMKDRKSGQYLFSVEHWHQRLLPDAWAHYHKQHGGDDNNQNGNDDKDVALA
jgi:hypothetical protein